MKKWHSVPAILVVMVILLGMFAMTCTQKPVEGPSSEQLRQIELLRQLIKSCEEVGLTGETVVALNEAIDAIEKGDIEGTISKTQTAATEIESAAQHGPQLQAGGADAQKVKQNTADLATLAGCYWGSRGLGGGAFWSNVDKCLKAEGFY